MIEATRGTPASCRIRSVTRRAEISTVGKPVPGCVLAPTKYRLRNRRCRFRGRKYPSCSRLWLKPCVDPFAKFSRWRQSFGVLLTSNLMWSFRSTIPISFSLCSTICLARLLISVQSMVIESLIHPTGIATTSVSPPSGASEGSTRTGACT